MNNIGGNNGGGENGGTLYKQIFNAIALIISAK